MPRFRELWIPAFAGMTGRPDWIKKLDYQVKATIGSLDPSCRQYLKTDEVSFTVPLELYQKMTDHWEASFLKENDWKIVTKK